MGGCAQTAITDRARSPTPVDSWSRSVQHDDVSLNWLHELKESDIPALVEEALLANFSLAEQRIRLEDSRQSVIVAGADRLPSLSASIGSVRRGSDTPTGGSTTIGTDYDASLAANWELDIWGELSAGARAARRADDAATARYDAARRELVASTVAQVYTAISARQLLALFEQRLASLQSTFDIVDGSYRRGLGNALDVYLAQNALEQQRETVAAQQQTVLESTATLQLSLGRYPDGNMTLPSTVPLYNSAIPIGMPSELLSRRQDIQAAWLELMASDARLAVAHKNRFPRLSLSGSGGRTSASLSDLLSSDESSWSFASSLVQPVFSGGRLRAAEAQARARTQALEQRYLAEVHRAFAEVENAISGGVSLQDRLVALQNAERNAQAALELSLEQYQRGLIGFTTVLEAQRRAFDTGTSLVRVQNLLVQNRVTLYRSLGGEFVVEE